MPVSSSIYSAIGQGVTPLEDPQNALLRALKMQGAQEEMQAQRMTRARTEEDYRRGLERSNRLQQLMSGDYADEESRADALIRGGFIDEGQKLLRGSAEIAQKRAATTKTLTETQAAQIAQHRDMLADVGDPETAMQWAQIGLQSGVLDNARYQLALQNIQRASASPEAFNAWKTQAALGATKFIEMNKPTYQTRSTGQTTDTIMLPGMIGAPSVVSSVQNTQSPDNAASNARAAADAEAARKQALQIAAMNDARQREATASARAIAQERLAFDRTRTPDEKPLNDTQSKALLFGSRMREAEAVLDALEKAGTTTSVPGSRSGYGIGPVVTAMSSSQKQQLDQAKRNFVNAVLRRESGAVIADSEFDNADKQYFPQIGDSKEVIAQKKRNRQLATQGILLEVPENRRNSLPPTPQMPTADEIRKQADNILRGG